MRNYPIEIQDTWKLKSWPLQNELWKVTKLKALRDFLPVSIYLYFRKPIINQMYFNILEI